MEIIKEQIICLLAYQINSAPQKIALSDTLDQLGMDSLDVIEFIMKMEEEFGIEIPDEEAEKFKTVFDVVNYIQLKSAKV